MHLAIGCVLIQIFTFDRPPAVQRRNILFIAIGLVSFVVYHTATDEFTLHVILFFSMSLTAILKTRRMIHDRVENDADKKKMSTLATFGACELPIYVEQRVC